METPKVKQAARESVTVFRYKKRKPSRWYAVPASAVGLLLAVYLFYDSMRRADDVLSAFWAFVGLGAAFFGVWSAHKVNEVLVEVSTHGIASISANRRSFANWDEVTKVDQFRSRNDRKLRLHFHTSRGDFVVSEKLLDFAEFLHGVKRHVGDRMLPEKKIWRTWRWTCSNCGTSFSRTSCGFCELPL
jgi:hypothetical protein